MVVPVLMTSCQVSENWNRGPLTAQAMMIPAASKKVDARTAANEVRLARSPKNFETREGSFCFSWLKTKDLSRRKNK